VLISAGALQAQTVTGGITGTATMDPPKPISRARITAVRLSPRPPIIVSATTDPNGGFAFSKLEPGVYELCVEATAETPDSCMWNPPPLHPQVTVKGNLTVSGVQVKVKKGATVPIRLNDATSALQSKAPNLPDPHVMIGVFSPFGGFLPAVRTGKDNNGQDHQILIPTDNRFDLYISSPHVEMNDDKGAKVPPGGVRIPLQASSASQKPLSPVTITVTGAKKP
jgi:hypothetical protein